MPGVRWHSKQVMKPKQKAQCYPWRFHCFNATQSSGEYRAYRQALSRAVKRWSILTPTKHLSQSPSVSIWIFENNGRSFWELRATKTSHLPYQDHSQPTFLSYHIVNYWKFINCWIYKPLLVCNRKWFKSQHLEYDNGAEQFLMRKQFCSCVWLVTLIYCVKMVTLFP